jgi:hypothetical protein
VEAAEPPEIGIVCQGRLGMVRSPLMPKYYSCCSAEGAVCEYFPAKILMVVSSRSKHISYKNGLSWLHEITFDNHRYATFYSMI